MTMRDQIPWKAFEQFLSDNNACEESGAWLTRYRESNPNRAMVRQAWEACETVVWKLWAIEKADRRALKGPALDMLRRIEPFWNSWAATNAPKDRMAVRHAIEHKEEPVFSDVRAFLPPWARSILRASEGAHVHAWALCIGHLNDAFAASADWEDQGLECAELLADIRVRITMATRWCTFRNAFNKTAYSRVTYSDVPACEKPVKPSVAKPALQGAVDTRTFICKVPREYVLQVLDYLHGAGDAISSVTRADNGYLVYLQGASETCIDHDEVIAWQHNVRGFIAGIRATAVRVDA